MLKLKKHLVSVPKFPESLEKRIRILLFTETICELAQSEPGSDGFDCMAMFYKSYHFNKDVGECQKVTYAGCGRTANNFATLEECDEVCGEYA